MRSFPRLRPDGLVLMSGTVLVESPADHIRVIRLNRPEKLNAMSSELMQDMFDAFTAVGSDNQCWVVILIGSGRAFCSGLDLDHEGPPPGLEGLTIPQLAPRAVRHFSRVVPAMRAMPQPVICAVRGPAYGGGMCLSLGGDIRIAGESARFNSTGIVNGLSSTELGASWLLPRLIGASRAHEFMLTGRVMEAEEAERVGLVSRVVPDDALEEEALATARAIARLSPLGVSMTKRVCWSNLEIPGLEAAIELEDRNQLLLSNTKNLDEAKRARREQRQPVYDDRHQSWPEDWDSVSESARGREL